MKQFLMSNYSEYAKKLQLLGGSLKKFDKHVIEVFKDNICEIIAKKKKKTKAKLDQLEQNK